MARRPQRKTTPERPAAPEVPKKRRGRPPKRHDEGAAAAGPRTIKRYGNRRFYDGRLSRCVTVEEIAGFVQRGEEVRVVDADSGEDLTKRVLVQLILEDSHRRQLEVLPIALLRMLLQLRDETMGRWFEQYLSTGSEWLQRQVDQLGQLGPAALPNPFTLLGGEGTPPGNLDALFPWLKMMAPGATNPFAPGAAAPSNPHRPSAAAPPRPTAPPPPAAAEEGALQDELAELQRRLAELAGRVKRR